MPRSIFVAVLIALCWIVWCVLVVTELVPALRQHVTMWDWLMAYVLCLAPAVALAIALVLRIRRT